MQLTEDWEYLDYFTEDEDLESAPNYNAKSYQILSVENGQTVLKKIKNLNIDKINCQSQFLVSINLLFLGFHIQLQRSAKCITWFDSISHN